MRKGVNWNNPQPRCRLHRSRALHPFRRYPPGANHGHNMKRNYGGPHHQVPSSSFFNGRYLREFEDLRVIPRVVHADCGKTIVGRNDSDAIVAEFTRNRRTEARYYLDHLNTCHEFFNLLAGAARIFWIVGCDEVRWVQPVASRHSVSNVIT